MNDEQRTSELLELDNMSTGDLWEKAVIIRDELTEEEEEIPYIILSKKDVITSFLNEEMFKKNEEGNIILDLNTIIDMTNEGFGIKMVATLLASGEGFYSLTSSSVQGIYGITGTRNRATLIEITNERLMRKRLLKRVLRKYLSNEESHVREYDEIEELIEGDKDDK